MYIEQDRAFTEGILSKLIGIFSVTGSEAEIGDYIHSQLKESGVDTVTRQPVTEHRFNVVATIKGERPGPRILFTGHMDTVPAGDGWETDPFSAVKRDGRMYGRGSLDMKGGIAAVLSTAKYVVEHKDQLAGELLIAFVADEEAYSTGVDTLIRNGLAADFGIAAEPEGDKAIVGALGKMLIRADIKGIASHGCQPEKGLNAIEEGARFLAALDQIPLLSHPNMPSQPYVTLKIEGGFKEYSIVVPESCSILINKHTVPAETKEYVIGEMEKLVRKLHLKAKFAFTPETPYYAAYDIGTQVPYLEKISSIFQDVVGKPLRCAYGTGVSDNNRIVPLTGIPVVSIGPCGDGMHSCNEWVGLESVHQMDMIYRSFVLSNEEVRNGRRDRG